MKNETMNLILFGEQGQVHVSRPLNQLGLSFLLLYDRADAMNQMTYQALSEERLIYGGKKGTSYSQREYLSKKDQAEILAPYSYHVSQDPLSAAAQIPRQIQINI